MLILNNEEIEKLLSIHSAMALLEKAYQAQAEGKATYRPRADLYVPSPAEGGVYAFKSMDGGMADPPFVALRLNSDVIHWERRGGVLVKDKLPKAADGKWVGLVLLFSSQTGEPVAIFPDGVMQRLRVAATSALAAARMAREDAAVLGMLGSGWQAGSHVPAMCAVRKIKRVQIFSPTKANRERFAAEMAELTGIECVAVESIERAAAGADILVAATNAASPVVQPEWLEPGMHLTCVKDSELGEATIRRADRVVIHVRRHAPDNYIAGVEEKVSAHDPVEILLGKASAAKSDAAPFWTAEPEMKDLISGKVPGRVSPHEITCFINNIGIGLQFAALGAAVYQQARAQGIGREIPTEWFVQSVHP
jgi:ornithine cyclodeaminase/alanine dehydrogenase-like protein (mu-crystallin family)